MTYESVEFGKISCRSSDALYAAKKHLVSKKPLNSAVFQEHRGDVDGAVVLRQPRFFQFNFGSI